MEEKKQQEQSPKKNKSDKMKTTHVAGHVVGAAAIGAGSYAYGQHRTSADDSGNEATGRWNEEAENTRTTQEEKTEQATDAQGRENEGNGIPSGDAVVEPEPIVHTDGIDFTVRVDDAGQVNEVVSDDESIAVVEAEPVVADLPEPTLPEPDLIADDFIGNTIQQDLFG